MTQLVIENEATTTPETIDVLAVQERGHYLEYFGRDAQKHVDTRSVGVQRRQEEAIEGCEDKSRLR